MLEKAVLALFNEKRASMLTRADETVHSAKAAATEELKKADREAIAAFQLDFKGVTGFVFEWRDRRYHYSSTYK